MKMKTECLVEACDVEMKFFGWSVMLRAMSTVPVWEEAAIMVNDNGKDKLVIYNITSLLLIHLTDNYLLIIFSCHN